MHQDGRVKTSKLSGCCPLEIIIPIQLYRVPASSLNGGNKLADGNIVSRAHHIDPGMSINDVCS